MQDKVKKLNCEKKMIREQAYLIGMGSYLPSKVLTNQDLEKIVDTTDEWIVSRTGMKERRIAGENEFTSTMGAEAAKLALKETGILATDLDLILVATMSPDYLFPSTAALIQADIGATLSGAMDIQAACSGFIYGLSIAKAFIESGMYKNILLVSSEKMSALLDYKDRSTCVLFGDGASACIISNKKQGFKIDTICLGADGEAGNILILPAGGTKEPTTSQTVEQGKHTLKMSGPELYKHAVRRMAAAAEECLKKSNLISEQIAWIVPHQANQRIMDSIAKSLSFTPEKIYRTVHKYGNTSSSSIPIALEELEKEHALNKGDNILLVAFGAGLTWGSAILTKEP